MEKYINPETDGQFYSVNSMVRANCHDCVGCSKCCEDMGDSIVLDPYDIYQFEHGLGMSFESLLAKDKISLKVMDYMLIPHMLMVEDGKHCAFLDEKGRCSVHANRPGICRLFPLGRDFQNDELTYILLNKACPNPNRSKVKVEKWIGIEDGKNYQAFIKKWHDFRREMAEYLKEASEDDAQTMSKYLLKLFYMTSYGEDSFYQEFDYRVKKIRNLFQ